MIALPVHFTVSCSADGLKAPGIPVGITLRMERRNHHFIIAGRTDEKGELVVQRDALVREAKASRDLFPTDYEPVDGPNGQFAGKIEVAVLTVPEIDAALRAYDQFHTQTKYPVNYRSDLEAGHKALSALAPKRIEVKVANVANDSSPSPTAFDTASIPYPVVAHTHSPASGI